MHEWAGAQWLAHKCAELGAWCRGAGLGPGTPWLQSLGGRVGAGLRWTGSGPVDEAPAAAGLVLSGQKS